MKNFLLSLFITLLAVWFVSCEKESSLKEPIISEDILKSNDLLDHKLIHVIDVSSDVAQDLVIPSVYDNATISITSTDSNLSYEVLTEGDDRVLRLNVDMPEGESRRIIPIKVSVDGLSDELSRDYSRNLFIVAIDKSQIAEVKSDAITSVYSQSMGRGTYCYGSLGNVTKSIFDYDQLVSYGDKYIIADRPLSSSSMYERSGDTYSETMTNWSFDVGADFKHTFGSWGFLDGIRTYTKSSKSLSGTANFGMSSNMNQSESYEYYFNFYKVQCQNIKIDISGFNSSQNTNITTVDTDFLSIINSDLIAQFQSANLDANSFVEVWGTDIIYKALYGGAFINYYARSENSYSQSVMYDADASMSYRNGSGNAAAGQWLQIFQAKNSDHISATADVSYMTSEYQKASNYCEGSLSYGGNYQDDVDEWVNGFSSGDNDDASNLSVLISYKPTSDTNATDEDFSLYQIDIFCGDLYNAIKMLYNDVDELTTADIAALEVISENVETISFAREYLIDSNLGVVADKSRLILADFMMVAESDNSHASGRPESFVAEDPNRSGEYLIYYPVVANKYALGSGVQDYALDTATSEYGPNMFVSAKSHVWYYALGCEGVVNPITDICFGLTPSDGSMVLRGDMSDEGCISYLISNGTWVKFDKVENSSDAITAVSLILDDGTIVGSSGGAEIDGSPSPEKLELFNTFWADGYTNYIDNTSDSFYYDAILLTGENLYLGYSTKDLPIDRANESTVYQAKAW